jgi:hypothetical protein
MFFPLGSSALDAAMDVALRLGGTIPGEPAVGRLKWHRRCRNYWSNHANHQH